MNILWNNCFLFFFFSPRNYSKQGVFFVCLVFFAKFKLVFDYLETKLEEDRGQGSVRAADALAISCIYKLWRNMCRMVAVVWFSNFFLLLFEKQEKKVKKNIRGIHQHFLHVKRQLITEWGEIAHFILHSSYTHCSFGAAAIQPEIFMSQCAVFALPGASFCK